MTTTAIAKKQAQEVNRLEKDLAKAQKKVENLEYEIEADAEEGRAVLMTMLNDTAEYAGAATAGLICAGKHGKAGRRACYVAGASATALRPFTAMAGGARLATAFPHGMGVGAAAITVYEQRQEAVARRDREEERERQAKFEREQERERAQKEAAAESEAA